MDKKRFFIETFGCQMNHHDSEKVAASLIGLGYESTENAAEADLLLLNTCNIREKANQKVFSRIGSLQKAYQAKPGAKLGLLGCMAQMEGEKIFEKAPNVDLVVGSSSYSFIPELLKRVEQGIPRVIDVSQDTDRLFEAYPQTREHPYKAFVTIMEGCNRFCSFCVVPFTRGPERSRSAEQILSEIRRLAREGYQEVMLLGQTVNSWTDPASSISSFAELLRRIAAIDGVHRIRFTSPHPSDFRLDIVDVIDHTPAVCNHIHLPAQSGSTAVLKRMKRDYTRDEYLARVQMLRSSKREISLSTDIIVGFPGESQEDFEHTLSLLETVQFDQVFSFKYSARPGTEAFDLVDDISEAEKSRRLAVLQEFQKKIQLLRNARWMGLEAEIFVEGRSQKSAAELTGRTTQNKIINFSGSEDLLGRFVRVRVTHYFPNSLAGELIANMS